MEDRYNYGDYRQYTAFSRVDASHTHVQSPPLAILKLTHTIDESSAIDGRLAHILP
jgi:hypothetical protein